MRGPPPTDTPLASLRQRVRDAGPAELRRLAAALECDGRRGARELAALASRRLEAALREQRRLSRLFAHRRALLREGFTRVAGVDEVGVGPLAGPVVAGAVILPERVRLPGLDDSKQLTAAARARLAQAIREQALAVGIGEVWPEEIDRLNIYRAALEAMRRAVLALDPPPDHLLVDARTVPGVPWPQQAIPHGDAEDGSIAAASIVAKVHRDAIMRRLDREHPGYGLGRHMGYATRAHLAALRERGPSPVHRRSFTPVSQLPLW